MPASDAETILVGRGVDRRDGLHQAIAADVVGQRQDPQVERIHRLDQPLHRVRRQLSLVAVNVDDRKLRLRHLVLDGDQRALRAVVEDARRRGSDGAWHEPGRVSVVPGGHSWPGAMRVPPPPRCATRPTLITPLKMNRRELFGRSAFRHSRTTVSAACIAASPWPRSPTTSGLMNCATHRPAARRRESAARRPRVLEVDDIL